MASTQVGGSAGRGASASGRCRVSRLGRRSAGGDDNQQVAELVAAVHHVGAHLRQVLLREWTRREDVHDVGSLQHTSPQPLLMLLHVLPHQLKQL